MRVLHTSDWHLGKSLYDFSLLEDQQHMIDGLLALLEREGVDAVLLCGDIYDRPVPSAQAVRLYDRFLSGAVGELGIPVIAIAGNHDSASRLEFGSSLTQASGYYVSGNPQKELRPVTLSDHHGPVRFYPIPYLHPADMRVQLEDSAIHSFDDAYRALLGHNRFQLDSSVRNVALAHGFFSGLSAQGELRELITSDSEVNIGGMDVAGADLFDLFDYTALGHLHTPQWTVPDRVRYSGTPLPYSLSEEGRKKSVTLIDLGEKGQMEIRTAELPTLRQVRTVRGTMKELLDPSRHLMGNFDDYVFAEIDGDETTYPMEKLRVLFPHLLGLCFTAQRRGGEGWVRPTGAARRQDSLEVQFLRFYREAQGEELPGEHRALVDEIVREMEEREVAVP